MNRRLVSIAGPLMVAAMLLPGCGGASESPAPTPPPPEPEAEVAAAPDAAVASLSDMAVQFDQLEIQQRQTNKQIADLLTRYQRRGGALPPGFGADLTDEQRLLLAERLKTERAGLRVLLQDIIDRDKQLVELKSRGQAMAGQLPERVDVKQGDRHDRIAMDFLIRKGVSAAKAYELISQINLQDALVPGFRVWNHYQNGQFGTWVTAGTAGVTPQQHQLRLTEMLTTERDAALVTLEAARADLADTRNIAKASEVALEQTNAELQAMTAAAERERAENERRSAAANTIQYVVGQKGQLVKQGLIDGRLRLRSVDAANAQSLNLVDGASVSVDGSNYGMKRVKKVTLVPEVFRQGIDYELTIDGPYAQLRILQKDKFAVTRFVAVVLE